jgi:hypothetical protein
MIRFPVAAAFAATLLWAAGNPAAAEDPKAPDSGLSPQTQKINELIAKGWESAGIKKTAAKATDHEFMRRAFIDLIGRIPTPEEIVDFENDRAPNKRGRLVYRLLNEKSYVLKSGGKQGIPGLRTGSKGEIDYNDAYAENMAELWTNWMLTRSNTNATYRNQFNLWLTQQFTSTTKAPNGTPWNKIVYDVISASGRSNSEGAVIFVIRHLGEPIAAEMGQKPDFNKDGKFDAVPITSRVTKLFLGIQSQCVQCHDHPFNKEYIQSDFWGVNAFFRQTDRSGTTNPRNLAAGITPPPLELKDEPTWNSNGMVLYERRDGQRKASFPVMLKDLEQAQKGESSTKRLVSGNIPSALEGKTRRQILAHWITEHDNFGKAFVNRMWGHLFGRGLNKEPTVDDFSTNNEVVHQELLDYLGEEFKKYNYDPKKLLEWICTSNVYQLSHVAEKAYSEQKYDPYFARMPLKALSPEVMFESLAVATRLEGRYKNKDKKEYDTLKAAWMQKLTQNFGDDEGNEINFNGTVVQALLMMNGKEINGELGSAKNAKDAGVVADVVHKHRTPEKIIDELFLMTVGRRPTPAERSKIILLQQRGGEATISSAPPKKGPTVKPAPKSTGGVISFPSTGADDVAFYQDVFWALLNSNEFMLNH